MGMSIVYLHGEKSSLDYILILPNVCKILNFVCKLHIKYSCEPNQIFFDVFKNLRCESRA